MSKELDKELNAAYDELIEVCYNYMEFGHMTPKQLRAEVLDLAIKIANLDPKSEHSGFAS